LHPFQGNLHKGMLHCPQGIPWSLKVQLLIQEYPFQIMLYFLQGILYFFKWHVHALRFLTETSPSFKGIVVYMKGFPLVQELKSYHTQPYSFTSTAVCLEGYFLKGMLHTFERNIVYNCKFVCIFNNIIQWIMLFENDFVFSKWITCFSKEYCIIPLFKSIFHEAIKYCLKGMWLFWKTLMYMQIIS
jgi:hypothetical protein